MPKKILKYNTRNPIFPTKRFAFLIVTALPRRRLKKREYFRPVAPIVLGDYSDEVFIEKGVNSPYMR